MNFEKLQFHHFVLLVVSAIVVFSVLIFGVFQFSATYGFVQVNPLNSLLLIPFIVLVLALGMELGGHWKRQPAQPAKISLLTPRELEIFQKIGSGRKNAEIAEELFVELSTVKSHINSIYRKLEISNRKEFMQQYASLSQQADRPKQAF